jgi:hypothetical protein
MPQEQLIATKVFRQVRGIVSMEGIWTLIVWLLKHANRVISYDTQPKGECIGILHRDGNPDRDEYIIVDIRVMGRTVFLGWIQVM